MKKTFIFCIIALFTLPMNAQLKVDSLGCTQIGGNILPTYYNTIKVYDATINTSKNLGGLYIRNFSNSASRYGINIHLDTSDSSPVGVNSWAAGMAGSTNLTCGVKGLATGGDHLIGVAGGVEDTPGTISCIGVCGSIGYNAYLPTMGTNYYAGYFQGDVRATGSIYGTLLSPSSISTYENSTTLIDTRDDTESVTERLQQVGLLRMERSNQDGSVAANQKDEDEVLEINLLNSEKTQIIPSSQKKSHTQTQLSSVSYGLAADQLKQVYPELVYEDGEGNYSINYIEMVPLLVQSIKELSAKVETLEQQLGTQKTAKKTKQQTSAVEKMKGTKSDKKSTTYDLSGRPATNPQRGVYVQDGKKVAIK